jgi:glycosyltransferase involved in cell wall biosynthesis
MYENLRVRVRGKGVTDRFQFVAELRVTVNLSVEDNNDRSSLVFDRLVSRIKSYDTEPAVCEADRVIEKIILTIGASMTLARVHRFEFIFRGRIVGGVDTGDTTHHFLIQSNGYIRVYLFYSYNETIAVSNMSDLRVELWFLIGMLPVGGSERTLVDLANGLDKTKYSVTVWTIVDEGPMRDELDGDVQYRTLDAKGKWDLLAPVRFLNTVRSEDPDILQSFLFFDNILARLSGSVSSNTKVITGVREVPADPSWIRSIIDKITLPLSDLVVSNSEAGAEYVIGRGADPNKTKVVRNGRNIEKYAGGNATPALFDSLDLNSDVPIVGTVGRLIERKGHYDLLKAWSSISTSYPDAQLVIVGDGPEAKSLHKYASELGCDCSVCFAGRRSDIPDLLDAMDVFVFPSHYEGLPGALLEAMIAGLPVVATPVDGNSELIENRVTGLFVPPHDSKALADCVTELLSDSELQRTLASAASDYVQEEFSIETMVSEFEVLYDDCSSVDVST